MAADKMSTLYGLLLLLVLGLVHVESTGKCQCYLDVITEGERERMYTMSAPFSGNCEDDQLCNQGCFDYANKMTHGGDLSWRPVGNSGPTVGDFGCGFIGGTLPKSEVEAFSKACDNEEMKVNLKVKQDFCCVDGIWPQGKCDDV